MPKKLAGLVLAVCITATPGLAQTTTELLQKGIYAQETEGNLDNAILIYRQIVNSAPSQRDLAAQAQFRLAQALLQKGDLTSAAQEFDKLARDYSDYRNLVSTLSGQTAKPNPPYGRVSAEFLYAPAFSALAEMTFDESKPVNVTGKVTRLVFSNPVSSMTVDGPAGHVFALPAFGDMMKQAFNKTTLKLGDQVQVSGVLAAEGQVIDGALASRADLVAVNGATVFDRSKLVAATATPGGNADKRQVELGMLQLQISELQTRLATIQTTDSDNPDVVKIKLRIGEAMAQANRLKKEMTAGGN
jgi:tetratricopeptide (TPR) repeat protein